MPHGPDRPKQLPQQVGVSERSIQQLTWNGQLLLLDSSDVAFKRALAGMLGVPLTPDQSVSWRALLEKLAPLGMKGRKLVMVRALLGWHERRMRFLRWWTADVYGGGSNVGYALVATEMIRELLLVGSQLRAWGLLEE